jgi:hypothetical protein
VIATTPRGAFFALTGNATRFEKLHSYFLQYSSRLPLIIKKI